LTFCVNFQVLPGCFVYIKCPLIVFECRSGNDAAGQAHGRIVDEQHDFESNGGILYCDLNSDSPVNGSDSNGRPLNGNIIGRTTLPLSLYRDDSV
jgi:hypothetical protein